MIGFFPSWAKPNFAGMVGERFEMGEKAYVARTAVIWPPQEKQNPHRTSPDPRLSRAADPRHVPVPSQTDLAKIGIRIANDPATLFVFGDFSARWLVTPLS